MKFAKAAVAVGALGLAGILSTQAATTLIVAVGTIAHSELFNAPATVTVRQILISPGEVLPWHYHPGRAYNIIKRGALTVEDGCGLEEQFKAGQAFEETEFHVHRTKNLGTEEVEVYNTFVVLEGSPTTVNIPNNERRCGQLIPVLTMEAARFCPGNPWTVKVSHGIANTSVHILGTQNGRSWRNQDWAKTDANGNVTVNGVFPDGTEGNYTERVEVGGLLSNSIAFTVSKCAP
jgi:quercetin dioxygenase-like cupin family protein